MSVDLVTARIANVSMPRRADLGTGEPREPIAPGARTARPNPLSGYGEPTMYADAEVWLLFGITEAEDGGATQRMWLKIAMGNGAAPGYRVEPCP
jgi:hypothetical protein